MAGAVESAGRFALPEQEGLGLCRTLGLAISNISMYGMEHSVAATSVTQAFDALVSKTDLYGEIEFVLGDAGLMVNGGVVVTERSTGQLLVDQITKLGVHDFVFVPPINRAEFTQFVLILAASPGSTAVADGFEAAIAKAELKSVRVANVSYARVDKNAPPPSPPTTRKAAATVGAKSFDLDLDIGMDDFMLGGDALLAPSDLGLVSAASSYLEQKQAAEVHRQKLLDQIKKKGSSRSEIQELRDQLLAAGLTEADWQDLLTASGVSQGGQTSHPSGSVDRASEKLQKLLSEVDALSERGAVTASGESTSVMSSILDAIGNEVQRISAETTEHVDSLAEKVDADRETVSQIEEEARAHGIGLSLSRDELLASLSEINQELAQPLTAATAVIDMLGGGTLGDISDAQRDVLAVASEGMNRLGELVAYLTRISGIPDTLSPDRQILDDAYGTPKALI